MEDERGGGASVIEAAQKLGLTAVTIDAVDRSGRLPMASRRPTCPAVSISPRQAFASDVGVDNDPIQLNGGYIWYDVLGITPSRERSLDEVKDRSNAMARRRNCQPAARQGTDLVQKHRAGGKLADQAASIGAGLKPPGLPARCRHVRPALSAVLRRHSNAKDGVGQTTGNWRRRVYRVPGHRRHRAADRSWVGRYLRDSLI